MDLKIIKTDRIHEIRDNENFLDADGYLYKMGSSNNGEVRECVSLDNGRVLTEEMLEDSYPFRVLII